MITEAVALLSATTAAIAIVIALANFGVARSTLALALFDRRMKVYEDIRAASSLALRGEKPFVEGEGLQHIHKAVNDGLFLFGPEMKAFLHTLWTAAIKVHAAYDAGEGRDLARTEEMREACRVLMDGTERAQPLMARYMAMDHKLPWRPIRKLFG
jgi:hypothetical protein